MTKNATVVRVGIGVFIFKDGKFLMQQRHGAHGAGSWSVPGGHLEFGESFEDTARREVKEETGLGITNVRFGAVTNDYFAQENKHYVTVWMISDWQRGTETITEPDKCLKQEWHTFDDLPSPLFLPWNQLLESQFIAGIKQALSQ
ncbi:MAG TPA: NUDIX hydrolase [Candidatus Saccharimonadales bacterium]|nr:NUDIX hydrolase [Candidatus Saccharimonadales bacterium]